MYNMYKYICINTIYNIYNMFNTFNIYNMFNINLYFYNKFYNTLSLCPQIVRIIKS